MPSAEIVGGGIAGLVASTQLARQGWSVRLHERSSALRASGNGLPIFENGLRVLEALGLGAEVKARGHQLNKWVIRRSSGEQVVEYEPYAATGGRIVMFQRQALIDPLSAAAAEAGVEICVGSKVIGAERSGAIVLEEWQASRSRSDRGRRRHSLGRPQECGRRAGTRPASQGCHSAPDSDPSRRFSRWK